MTIEEKKKNLSNYTKELNFQHKNIEGFKKLYSYIVKDQFLGAWISNDKKYQIYLNFKGTYDILPYDLGIHLEYWNHSNYEEFRNIETIDKAEEIYNKYLK